MTGTRGYTSENHTKIITEAETVVGPAQKTMLIFLIYQSEVTDLLEEGGGNVTTGS